MAAYRTEGPSAFDRPTTRRTFLGRAAAAGLWAVLPLTGTARAEVCGASPGAGALDVLVRGGTVVDGTGKAPFEADVGVRGDRILSVAPAAAVPARRVIEAAGLLVTPGFIDVHTHYDLAFRRAGMRRFLAYGRPSWSGHHNGLHQGVTTVITGNCGHGDTDTERWLAAVAAVDFGINVGHLVPYGTLRRECLGPVQPRTPDRRRLERLAGRIAEELDKGAFGLSTGLEYWPGCLAGLDELTAAARVAGRRGRVYATHLRDESGRPGADGRPAVLAAIGEALEIGRRAGAAVEISHLKVSAPINGLRGDALLEAVARGRDAGLPVRADQYPYAAGAFPLAELLPRGLRPAPGGESALCTPGGRRRLADLMTGPLAALPPDRILITQAPADPGCEGLTLAVVSERRSRSAADCFAALVGGDPPPQAVFCGQDRDAVRRIMEDPETITASDGWTAPDGAGRPHPRAYGTFVRKLGRFARDGDRRGLAAAVRTMSGLPSEAFGIEGRGRIVPGAYADLCVIDPRRLRERATYRDPARYAEGVRWVLVNGVAALAEGRPTRRRGGRPLRRT